MPLSKHLEEWASTKPIVTRTGKKYRIHAGVDPYGRRKPGEIWVKAYGNFLGEYRAHPEAKFVDREGNPCRDTTQGLLRPSHIVAREHRYIGKETSRHWEQGDDMSLVDFRCMEYRGDGKVIANKETIARMGKFSERQIEKGTGLDRKTIRLIRRGIESVKPVTLSKIIKFLDEQKPKTKPFSEDTLADLPDLKELRDVLDPKKDKEHIALLNKRINRLEARY